jgi:hypothetical protein
MNGRRKGRHAREEGKKAVRDESTGGMKGADRRIA